MLAEIQVPAGILLFLQAQITKGGVSMTDISMAIAQIKRQIDFLKQQIEEANPGEVHRLRRQLKEMQILQLWQIEQQENQNTQRTLPD